MSLPTSIRVKLSSEDAGALTITPVVSQEMPFAEFLERIVENTGKDIGRIIRILRVGELASGATRYRFAGWEVDSSELTAALARFPDADPSRQFVAQHSTKAIFHGAMGARLEMAREVGTERRFLQRRAFWESLLQALNGEQASYIEYSYKEKADCYRIQLSRSATASIQNAAGLIAYKGLAQKIRLSTFGAVDMYVPR